MQIGTDLYRGELSVKIPLICIICDSNAQTKSARLFFMCSFTLYMHSSDKLIADLFLYFARNAFLCGTLHPPHPYVDKEKNKLNLPI